MLQRLKVFTIAKTLLISALAISLAACSSGSNGSNSSTSSSGSPSTSSADSASSQKTDPKILASLPGVKDVGEIKFKASPKGAQSGYFNAANGSKETKQQVSKSAPFTVGGWAVLTDESKVPDTVIVTVGDNNTVVAVAPVNLERSDVATTLKNPAYQKSGWIAAINPSNLPTGKVVLKAWAYNSTRKEATQLNNTFEVVIPN